MYLVLTGNEFGLELSPEMEFIESREEAGKIYDEYLLDDYVSVCIYELQDNKKLKLIKQYFNG
jgi:hypothetical protein